MGKSLAVFSDRWRYFVFSWICTESPEFWFIDAGLVSDCHRTLVSVYECRPLVRNGKSLADICSGARDWFYPDVFVWSKRERFVDTSDNSMYNCIGILCPLLVYFSILAAYPDRNWTVHFDQCKQKEITHRVERTRGFHKRS